MKLRAFYPLVIFKFIKSFGVHIIDFLCFLFSFLSLFFSLTVVVKRPESTILE